MGIPRKLEAKIVGLKKFGTDVFEVVFESVNKPLPRINAGQFLHLAFDKYDATLGYWPESRVFSIASINLEERRLSIVYSIKGVFTHRMKNELFLGRSVWLKLPYGDFILENYLGDTDPIVLIAGGTGISPFIPFISNMQNFHTDLQPVFLFYGYRSNELFLFEQDLQLTDKMCPLLNIRLFCEAEADNNSTVTIGTLNIEDIYHQFETDEKTRYFISGPPNMVKTFQSYLISKDICKKNIIIDNWE